jgi:protein O-GlcNAc transferase
MNSSRAADDWFDRLRQMEGSLREAVRHDENNAANWDALGAVLTNLGRAAEGEACARRAIELDSSNAMYWLNLGTALDGLGRPADALEAYRQSLARDPNSAAAWANMGAVEQRLGRWNEAEQAYQRSEALEPNRVQALLNYAGLLNARGQPRQAIELLSRIAEPTPRSLLELGNALQAIGQTAQAEAHYRRAVEMAPGYAIARFNLATMLVRRWSISEAEHQIRPLLDASPASAAAWTLLSLVQQMRAASDAAIPSLERAFQLEPTPVHHSKLLLGRQYIDEQTPQQLLVSHREWSALHTKDIQPLTARSIRRAGPLRLGFVSRDFRQHPIAFLALPAIEQLDKTSCSVVCYSDSLAEDEYTPRFRAAADIWRVTAGLSNEELARQIAADQIDVLIDLMGHTGERLLAFAARPAPVQVTWLGYVGTTGLAAMDFLLADRFHVRPGEEAFYSESILRMPHGYACYSPPPGCGDVSPLPAAESARVTFGCFNNPAKYNLRMLAAWAEILVRVPHSQLLLKFPGIDDPLLQARLRETFTSRGIAADRLLLEGWSPHLGFLQAYNRVDLALDTQPYSGGLTTCEALWMGVPVITFPGKTFAGRHAYSHLMNAGYPQFVADDLSDYIDLATQWATRLEELAALRSGMRDQVRRSPLCDGPRFARDFLALVEHAWASRCGASAAAT